VVEREGESQRESARGSEVLFAPLLRVPGSGVRVWAHNMLSLSRLSLARVNNQRLNGDCVPSGSERRPPSPRLRRRSPWYCA